MSKILGNPRYRMGSVLTPDLGLVSGELLAEMHVTSKHKMRILLTPTHAGGKPDPSIVAFCLDNKAVIAYTEVGMKPSDAAELCQQLFEELAMQCHLKKMALREEER